jgi:hypothetical protein
MTTPLEDRLADALRTVLYDPHFCEIEYQGETAEEKGTKALAAYDAAKATPSEPSDHVAELREVARKMENASIPGYSHVYAAIKYLSHQRERAEAAEAEQQESESGRQYWMREALGRETEGDDRDIEMRRLVKEKEAADKELADVQASLELQHKSNDRARTMWQSAQPDQQLTWPDRTKMLMWLLDQYAAAEAKVRELDDECSRMNELATLNLQKAVLAESRLAALTSDAAVQAFNSARFYHDTVKQELDDECVRAGLAAARKAVGGE